MKDVSVSIRGTHCFKQGLLGELSFYPSLRKRNHPHSREPHTADEDMWTGLVWGSFLEDCQVAFRWRKDKEVWRVHATSSLPGSGLEALSANQLMTTSSRSMLSPQGCQALGFTPAAATWKGLGNFQLTITSVQISIPSSLLYLPPLLSSSSYNSNMPIFTIFFHPKS